MKDFKEMLPEINTIYCVGRNYVEHIEELGNKVESEPVIFLKPNSSLNTTSIITLPKHSNNIHHEVELVLLIGKDVNTLEDEQDCIVAYTVGIDLTARDVQTQLKEKRLPWTLAKGFKGSAIIADFIPAPLPKVSRIELAVNGEVRQSDTTDKLIYDIPYLIHYISDNFGLKKGDLIYTGTPSGVGRLVQGDLVTIRTDDQIDKSFEVE